MIRQPPRTTRPEPPFPYTTLFLSQESTTALTWAAAEAQRRGASLLIIYGLHMPIVHVPLSGAVVLPPTDELEKYARSVRSEEHTSELQSLMRRSYAVFCLKKKTKSKIEA